VSDLSLRLAGLSPAKRALLEIEMEKRREALEPVAIVGIGCRFPGASGPAAFWSLLRDGVDAISEIPADRWDAAALYDPDPGRLGKMSTRWGGFLERVDAFDAAFFGVSPREAVQMDPQQRLLLEVAWEALEDAGLVPERLQGTRTGVFVGVMTNDYARLVPSDELEAIDVYSGTGTAYCITANRLSYVFGLEGPSLAVDTACSSSLVAVHLACQSLRSGECSVALAGGVNVMLWPGHAVYFTRAGLMAADGRCKTFDERADGFVRGEGAGVVVLKPLARALADGDPVYAVIRGSAVNQDGRSNGLTAPNLQAQVDVVEEACRRAGISPGSVQYVEAHGTGTALGDPIEAAALGRALAADRPAGSRCGLGSVKTNIGHLEAAAGIAGLIKLALSLRHREIPPSLHFERPNPKIPFENLPLYVQQALEPWPVPPGSAVAGVSSFGFGGTNAHLVLTDAPLPETRAVAQEGESLFLLPISAHSAGALRDRVRSWRSLVESKESSLDDLCWTAAIRRSHHEHRLAVTGATRHELIEGLDAYLRGEERPGVATGQVLPGKRRKLAFVFPGQGSQWAGMGRELRESEPVFRRTLEACDAAFREHVDWSLLEELEADERRSRLGEINVVQPALFAMQVALAALWRSWGIEPDAVIGQSLGEVAAACVAGALDLRDAARVICRRNSLMRSAAGRGAMAAVELSLEEAARILAGREERVAIAVSSGPRSIVLSGDPEVLREILEGLERDGVFCRWINADVASHSPFMDPLREPLVRALADLRPHPGEVPICSTVTGEVTDGAGFDAVYWARNLRETVLFAGGVRKLLEDGFDLFLEISPHPLLPVSLEQCFRQWSREAETRALPSMRKGEERPILLQTLGCLYAAGRTPDFPRFYPAGGRCVPLPAYPWQRERFWIGASSGMDRRREYPFRNGHPLLGPPVRPALAASQTFWEAEIAAADIPFLRDHRVGGTAVLPAAAVLEMALAAGAEALGARPVLEGVRFNKLLSLPDDSPRRVQFALTQDRSDAAGFHVFGADGTDDAWTLCAEGRLALDAGSDESAEDPPDIVRARCSTEIPAPRLYERLAGIGLEYGPSLRRVERLWVGEGEALGLLLPPEPADVARYRVPPALLDAAFHVLAALLPDDREGTWLPVGLGQLRVSGNPAAGRWCRASLRADADGGQPEGDLALLDDQGSVVLSARGLRLHRLNGKGSAAGVEAWLHRLEWEPAPPQAEALEAAASGRWLVLADAGGLGEELASLLEARGGSCVLAKRDQISEIRPEALRDLAAAAPGPLRGVLYLWGLDGRTPGDAEEVCLAAVHLIQALADAGGAVLPGLVLVTRGAQPAAGAPVDPAQAPLWGLGRTAACEHPALRCRLLDLDPEDGGAGELLKEILSGDAGEVALRGGSRHVPRWRPGGGSETTAPPRLSAEGTYLITGGLGGLGLAVAAWMVDRGVRHLALLGRREPAGTALETVERLRSAGAGVLTLAADVADRGQLAGALAEVEARMPPLRGVVHAAGVLEDATLTRLDRARLRAAMAPKIVGSWNLHELTLDRPLDFFVLFSSLAGSVGVPGQGNYAAANAFLDALAWHRRSRGLPALSVAWAAWSEIGLAARPDRGGRLAGKGFASLRPAQGLAALERLLGGNETHVAVAPFDPERWREAHTAPGAPAAAASSRESLREAPAERREALATASLRRMVARVLRLPLEGVEPDRPLTRMGLDSLMALELRNRAEAELGVTLPVVSLLRGPSVAELARKIAGELTEDAEPIRKEEGRSDSEHPLSFGQRAWWFLHQLEPENPTHTVVFAARVRSAVDVPALRRAWEALAERHPVLRTTYHERDGEPIQVVRAESAPLFAHVDAGGWSWPELRERAVAEARRPFDLERGPVLRVTLFSRAADDHVLLLAIHHVAADLWSLTVLLHELRELYPAACRGETALLPPLSGHYTDFVRQEAEVVAGPEGERLWEYWQRRLAGDLPVLALPTDRPRGSSPSDRGAVYKLSLGLDLTTRLRRLCEEHEVTPFVALLAIFEVLLYRHSGQTDLLVGTLAAQGRSRPELAGVVGFLDNPVVLREDLRRNPPFATFLAQARQTALEALEHQGYPFSLLVQRRQPDRDLGRAPIFQVMFILQRSRFREEDGWLALEMGEAERAELGGLDLERFELDRQSATALAGRLDLSLLAADLGSRLALAVQYNPDLFDRATVARFAAHLRGLTEALLERPETLVGDLPLLTPAERRQVACEWNDTAGDFPAGATLHGLFEARAAQAPEAVAVLAGERSITYGELSRRVRGLAWRLRRRGVRRGVLVGICVEPSIEMVVGLLAVLEAGGAYVPLDPAYPLARLEFLIRDAGVHLLLTQERLRQKLPLGERAVLVLDGREEPRGARRLPGGSRSGDMAYVIYTSGSTGQPKGVMIDHRGAVNTVACINHRFSITAADRIFAVSSLSFDLSVYDVFGTLAAGAAIVLPAPSEAPSPALWLQRMRQHGVSVWNSAPALMEMLQGYVAGRSEGLPSTLRLVLLSGDWIPVSLPGQIRRQSANVQVVSLGGATEASIWSIFYPIGEVAPGWASIPYGRPMLNQRFHVLDGAMEPAPVGVVGELYIGGIGVALGYLGRPSLTAERFLPDPFAAPEEGPGARLYRTGDLGRYLTGGEIEFLGRADHQVKVRGFRIEVGEIEAQLLQHRDIREAVVTVRDDLPGGRQLIGYYTGGESAPPSPDALRRHLRQTLPEHMIPAFLVPLAALPLTPNGKIDRRALPAPAPAAREEQTDAGLFTPSEEILAAIWSEVLGLESIGTGDNFFELGGHSLTATQVASRIRERVGIDLSLRQIFEALTLHELAERLDASLRTGGAHQLEDIEPVSRAGELPLSFAQERLWFAEQLAAGASAYNMAVALEIRGPLDLAALAGAAAEIIRRHESLRTRFLSADAGPLQVSEPRVDFAVPLVDISGLPEAARKEELRRLSGEAARYPYDLAVAPLLQAWLLRLGSVEHRLLVSMHHIVSDGWSMGVFLRELCRLYEDIATTGASSLPRLPIQYADFAAWQRRWLQGEALESLLGYWRQRLAGAPEVLALPTDRPRPAVRSLRGANRSRLLPPDLRAGLKDLSRRCGATLFMTVLAAFKVLLSRYSGQLDILVGTDIAGRNRRELEGLIGFFVNHPVLRTDLSGNPTFVELLDRVRRVTLEAYAHQDLPFEKLVEELQPERDLSRAPLFQILFVLQNVPLAALQTPDLAFTPMAVDSGRCKFDLILMMWELEDGLQETWTYSTDLFAEATIARMSEHLEALLRQIVARPEIRLSDLEMLTEQEREQQNMEREQRQSLEANTLRRSRRRAVDLASISPISLRTIMGGETRCLVVEPARQDVDLIEWIRTEPDFLDSKLRELGAVLFRGFPVESVAEFERFAQEVCPELFGEYGDLPRAGLEGKVYTSTPYPPDQWILYHNESSHLDRWPLKQFFHCVQPAERGGETPIADCRRVYQRLDPEIRCAFAERGVMYVRNFTPGIDVSWQEFFHTDNREEVEASCRAAGLDIEWREDGSLRTRKVCPAVARHPSTGEDVFFNQIQAHHIFCVSPEVRESLLALFPEESLPRNVYFGDGSPIADSVMQQIIDVYHQVAVSFAWQKGDILVVDNMLVAHSRAPFAGERKIVVTMGEMVAHEPLCESPQRST